MGLFGDLMDAIFNSGGNPASDPKQTRITEDDGVIRVKNGDVIIDKSDNTHDTVWSNTWVDTKTGNTKFDEGAHGPHFKE